MIPLLLSFYVAASLLFGRVFLWEEVFATLYQVLVDCFVLLGGTSEELALLNKLGDLLQKCGAKPCRKRSPEGFMNLLLF